MRKQTWIINVLLLAAVIGLGAKLQGDWKKGNQRQAALQDRSKTNPASAAISAGASVTPVAETELVVANNLFSPDRNNTPQAATAKPTPPTDPTLLGTMNLGSGWIAIMTDGASANVRQVKTGEMIGAFKVAKIGDSFVMVEFEGQQKRVDVTAAPHQVGAPATAAAEPASRQVPNAVPVTSGPAMISKPIQVRKDPLPSQPSLERGDPDTRTARDMFDGKPDTYPVGAVVDGYQKMARPSPFGQLVWWEKVKK